MEMQEAAGHGTWGGHTRNANPKRTGKSKRKGPIPRAHRQAKARTHLATRDGKEEDKMAGAQRNQQDRAGTEQAVPKVI